MIPDEVVEQVSQAADIVAIIGEHVRLKKVGSVYRGPCPFHQGTNNNFSVLPKGGYTCFVEEIPATISQGETLEEAKANLMDALQLVLHVRRELAIPAHDFPLSS